MPVVAAFNPGSASLKFGLSSSRTARLPHPARHRRIPHRARAMAKPQSSAAPSAGTGTVGPDLTHFGSRRIMLASDSFSNNNACLAAWITLAQSLKPAAQMPDLTQFHRHATAQPHRLSRSCSNAKSHRKDASRRHSRPLAPRADSFACHMYQMTLPFGYFWEIQP